MGKGFVFHRGPFAEDAAPSCGVGEGFDVFEAFLNEVTAGCSVAPAEKFELRGPEEGLRHGLVEGLGHFAHRSQKARRAQPAPENRACALRAPVGVDDRPPW